MTRYPSCTWKPITGTSTTPLTKDILCLHTMVGYLRSTWNYFNRTDVGVYSHIGVGGIWGADVGYNLDGVAWQMADTDYRAAANLDGNDRVISVETADNAANPIAAWTPAQCDRLVAIMVDAHRLDGIPLELIPDTKQGRRGIAYHRQGIDPWRVAGGELWSSSKGKVCPGDARIAQIPGLIKRAVDIVNGTTPQEIDVTPEQLQAGLAQFFHTTDAGIKQAGGTANNDDIFGRLLSFAQGGFNADNAIKAAIVAVKADTTVQGDDEAKILAALADVQASVDALTPKPPVA